MRYEIANQLWEAGYPFKHRDGDLKFMCACTKNVCEGPFGKEFRFKGNLYPEPTLFELIEACEPLKADSFMLSCGMSISPWEAGLIYHGYFDGWPGIKRDMDGFVSIDIIINGDIPDEAVANLFLALNKKV